MNEDLYAKALNIKMTELMKKDGDYYPFEHSNFREFMDNITDEQSNRLADLCSQRVDVDAAGWALKVYAKTFWTRLARIEAEARLAEECQQCWGLGCPACEDKEHDDD
jgi:hypothetical protein